MESHFKECKVILLDCNIDSPIALEDYGILKYIGTMDNGYIPTSTQKTKNLYILSDDEIKGGDWFYNKLTNEVYQANKSKVAETLNTENCFKVIATTNKKLKIREYSAINSCCKSKEDCYCYLPLLSDKFINRYVETFNKGEKIDKVFVEYEEKDYTIIRTFPRGFRTNYAPKLKDNFVITKEMKNNWNREELKSLIKNSLMSDIDMIYNGQSVDYEYLDKWFKENL